MMRLSALVFTLLVSAYAVLGLYVIEPVAVYSGDIGVKFVQARALAESHLTSLDIPYRGEFLDPGREFVPLRPPFVMVSGGSTQAIFSPTSAVINAAAVAFAGMNGMILTSLAAGLIILAAAWRLSAREEATATLLGVGIASPLWFYAVSGWEHAPAVALSTSAFAVVVRSPPRAGPLLAGLCLGIGTTLRDEALLLAPALVLAVWMTTRRILPLVWVASGIFLPLALAASLEVWWFNRPVAAHLRHAVHLIQSALRVAEGANPDVPALRPFTLQERYETVVQYWLLGYGRNGWITGYVAALAAALALRFWLRSSLGILAWVLAVVALAWTDLHELVTAPKWLAGLHRVSPYLVFALLPLPVSATRRDWYVPVILLGTTVYLIAAFAGADTSGGKSLGPRLLLPLVPLLIVASISTMRRYLSASMASDRWIGRAGVLLLAMSAAMHLLGTIPAYVARNRDDSRAILSVSSGADRIVVADDAFTAQLLFPLYYRKIVFLADTPDLGERLGAALDRQRVAGALLVSRLEHPIVQLPPFRLSRSEQQGRMLIQYWRK